MIIQKSEIRNLKLEKKPRTLHSLPISNFQFPVSQQGFTLIEMLIVILLVAVLSIVITQMFIGQNRLFQTQFSELTVLNDARAALDDIDNFVRSATRVINSHDTYSTGSQTLVIQLQSVNAANQLIPGSYDVIVFYLDSGQLYRRAYPEVGSARTTTIRQLAAGVSNLNFTYNDVDLAQVTEVSTELTVINSNNVQNRSVTSSTKSVLRNY